MLAGDISFMSNAELLAALKECDRNIAHAQKTMDKYRDKARNGRFVDRYNGAVAIFHSQTRLWNDLNSRAWEVGAYS